VDIEARGISAPNKSLRGKWHIAVATVIAASRRQCGLTQDQLAGTLQWHRSRIAKIECGERGNEAVKAFGVEDHFWVTRRALFSAAPDLLVRVGLSNAPTSLAHMAGLWRGMQMLPQALPTEQVLQ
jgi:transcriptional regulator with XRE-family HTH domain